jgi:Beta-lactamase superfamily domain
MWFALLVIFLLIVTGGRATQAAESDSAPRQRVTLKWLGTAGWEIQYGQSKILVDPFLTRKQPVAEEEWQTDEAAVLSVINGSDYIFAGHSHGDHIADVPFIAKRFGSKVIGSRTTVNLSLSAGVDKSQLTAISGGEKFDFKDFSVEVIESQHGVLNRGGQNANPGLRKSPDRCPVRYLGGIFSRVEAICICSLSANCGYCTKAPATLSKRISTDWSLM